jgi:hypothetical protein
MSTQPVARFRSATEFPKTIQSLDSTEAERLYVEMRECLIFTNRSRAQLVRRNEEHKQNTLQVKANVEQLQQLIQQLNLEKQQTTASNQQIVSELTQQITSMSVHLDQLTEAFDGIADIESPAGFIAQPSRFFRFLRAIRAIVMFWREEQDEPISTLPTSKTALPEQYGTDEDRRNNPQMYQDSASQGRSLLDK